MSITQEEVDLLTEDYVVYIRILKIEWFSKNRVATTHVYEVMSPEEREEVDRLISRWKEYITPLAESWWGKHGFGVVWPEDDSMPMKLYKLKTKAA